MALSHSEIEAMAPGQSALKAAAGLLKPAKWSSRSVSGGLIWDERQGSGTNPYRVTAKPPSGPKSLEAATTEEVAEARLQTPISAW